jgi:hypothetical protein
MDIHIHIEKKHFYIMVALISVLSILLIANGAYVGHSWDDIVGGSPILASLKVTDDVEVDGNINGTSEYAKDADKLDGFDSINLTMPAGAIMAFAIDTCPDGWLFADGSSIQKSSYPNLNAALNGIYGQTALNFNLPDYRGYFLRGLDNGAGNDPDSGTRTNRGDGTVGDNVGTVQIETSLIHNHMWHSYPGHPETFDSNGNSQNFGHVPGFNPWAGVATWTGGEWINNNYYTNNAFSGVESRPKNKYILYCIKI